MPTQPPIHSNPIHHARIVHTPLQIRLNATNPPRLSVLGCPGNSGSTLHCPCLTTLHANQTPTLQQTLSPEGKSPSMPRRWMSALGGTPTVEETVEDPDQEGKEKDRGSVANLMSNMKMWARRAVGDDDGDEDGAMTDDAASAAAKGAAAAAAAVSNGSAPKSASVGASASKSDPLSPTQPQSVQKGKSKAATVTTATAPATSRLLSPSRPRDKSAAGGDGYVVDEKEPAPWANISSNDWKWFPKVFPQVSVPVDEYNCALNHLGFLIQGKVYVTATHLCFYSGVGAKMGLSNHKVVVRWVDVSATAKATTFKVIPNAIQIDTAEDSFFFQSFLNRNSAYRCFTRMRDDCGNGRITTGSELELLVRSGWKGSDDESDTAPSGRSVSPGRPGAPGSEGWSPSVDAIAEAVFPNPAFVDQPGRAEEISSAVEVAAAAAVRDSRSPNGTVESGPVGVDIVAASAKQTGFILHDGTYAANFETVAAGLFGEDLALPTSWLGLVFARNGTTEVVDEEGWVAHADGRCRNMKYRVKINYAMGPSSAVTFDTRRVVEEVTPSPHSSAPVSDTRIAHPTHTVLPVVDAYRAGRHQTDIASSCALVVLQVTGRRMVVESVTKNPDVPYGKHYSVKSTYYLSSNGGRRTRLIVKGTTKVTGAYLSKTFIVWACEKGLREFWEGASTVLEELFGKPIGHDGIVNDSGPLQTGLSAATAPQQLTAAHCRGEITELAPDTVQRSTDEWSWAQHALMGILAISIALNYILWRQLRADPTGVCTATDSPTAIASDLAAMRDMLTTLVQRLPKSDGAHS